MDNDSIWGSRSNEPRPLAQLRHLHVGGVEGSDATGADDWYETERLTGQITGGAHRVVPDAGPPTGGDDVPTAPGGRHPQAIGRPSALERLRLALEHLGRRDRAVDAQHDRRRLRSSRRVGGRRGGETRDYMASDSGRPQQGRVAVENDAAGPGGEPAGAPRNGGRSASLHSALRTKRRGSLRLRRSLAAGALVLGATMPFVVSGITAERQSDSRTSAQTSFLAVAAADVLVDNVAEAMTSGLGKVERHIPSGAAHQTARRTMTAPTRRASRPASTGGSASPPTRIGVASADSQPVSQGTPESEASASNTGSSSPGVQQTTVQQTSVQAPTQTPVQQTPVQQAPTRQTSGSQTPSQPAGPTGLGTQVGTSCSPKCS